MTTERLVWIKATLNTAVDDYATWVEPPSATDQALADTAAANFKAASPSLLDDITPFLWAYYRSVRDAFTASERSDYGIPELVDGTDIWESVMMGSCIDFAPGHGPFSPAASYLSFEGEVTWEPEHGLQVVFQEGQKLCKVGPYDGHMTNAHAWADLSLLDVVFAG